MTDVRLRDAERRALSGSVEDQARALVARLRTAPGCERCGGTGRLALVPGTSMAMDEDRRTFRPARPGETPYGVLREDGSAVEARPGYYHRGRADTSCPSCVGTGSPFRARVELAAYAGSEAARLVVPDVPGGFSLANGQRCAHDPGLSVDRITYPCSTRGCSTRWLSGLSRWADIGPAPGWILVRASVAAARVAPSALRCDDPHSNHPDWQAPSGHRASECGRGVDPRRAIEAAEAWLACPCEEHWTARHVAHVEAVHLAWLPPPGQDAERHRDAIRHAARLAGEAPVLNAIRSSLIEWSLGGER
jgi:hypothetical protein